MKPKGNIKGKKISGEIGSKKITVDVESVNIAGEQHTYNEENILYDEQMLYNGLYYQSEDIPIGNIK